MADRYWDRGTFYEYKRRPWILRKPDGLFPISSSTEESDEQYINIIEGAVRELQNTRLTGMEQDVVDNVRSLALRAAVRVPDGVTAKAILAVCKIFSPNRLDGLEELVALARANPEVHLPRCWLARILFEEGKHQEAVEQSTRALEVDNSCVIAYHTLVAAYIALGQIEEALTIAAKVIEKFPRAPAGYSMRGSALHSRKSYEEASESFLKAITLGERDGWLFRSFGMSLAMRGRRKEAKEQFVLAVKRMPNDVLALTILANFHVLDRERRQAVELLNRALELDPTNVDVLESLATAHKSFWKRRKYQEYLRKAEEARAAQEQLERQGSSNEAEQDITR